MVTDKIPN